MQPERPIVGARDMQGIARAFAGMRGQQDTASTVTPESLRLDEKEDFNLSDLNPLIHALRLTSKESINALSTTALRKIKGINGLMPAKLESSAVYNGDSMGLRYIARFEVPELDEEKMSLLETLVADTYGVSVRTRKDSKGNDITAGIYPPIQRGHEMLSKTGGWYMGPDVSPTTSLHMGLFVFKDLGQVNKDNFFDKNESSTKYIVEIREADMPQMDLTAFTVQVANVLGNGELLDHGELLYETYYDLIRLGLKKVDHGSIYGMELAKDRIIRGLLTPLASPDITRGVGEEAQSVLLVGVPGTGKTLIVEQLLQEETGTFILPLDPLELQKEIRLDKDKQKLFQRIGEVHRLTGKNVILHIDDIENMVNENDNTNSTILNLLAGVRASGFHIIASTNTPEKINPALLEPQRFGILIHCGLQSEEARFEILKIHSGIESVRLHQQLFRSAKERDIILREVAAHTEAFTPRFLAAIANSAKSFLVGKVQKEKGTFIDLTEEDLEGHAFSVEDWDNALREVSSRYPSTPMKNRDDELKQFVDQHKKRQAGFLIDRTGMSNGIAYLVRAKELVESIDELENPPPKN